MTSTPIRPPQALSRDERSSVTRELLERAAVESEEARRSTLDEVVVINMRVAEAVARRFARRGVPLEDLQQVAYMALVRAVRAFDPSREGDLLSYAVPSMEGELRRHFRDHSWAVRPPREVQRAHARIVRSGHVGEKYDGEALAALAREVDESTAAVREALVARNYLSVVSLDVPGVVADQAVEDDEVRRSEARMVLAPVLAQLAPQERRVLHLRFVEDLTQREIAEQLGASQVQVCRMLQRVLAHLRGALHTDA